MTRTTTKAIRQKAKAEGYNCQLTGWEDLAFVKAKQDEVLKDPDRKAKIYARIANKKMLYALFVDYVGDKHFSTKKSEDTSGRLKNRRDFQF